MTKWQKGWLAALLALLVVGLTPPQPRKAAGFETNLVSSYGIPAAVVQVMLANSRYPDGQTPAAMGQTPATFTIGDVQRLAVVSLASRTLSGDTAVSTPAPAVAAWVAGLAAGPGYEVADNAYGQNREARVTGTAGSLVQRVITVDGRQSTAPFNFLMQIVASARQATVVDLTGLTSQVQPPTLVPRLLSLLQTDRLGNLQTLVLGQNNLLTTDYYQLPLTLFGVSATQRVTTLDLSGNALTFAPGSFNYNAFGITTYLTQLAVGDAPAAVVQGWLAAGVRQVVANGGDVHLEQAQVTGDYETLDVLLKALAAKTGRVWLSSDAINALLQAVPAGRMDWQLPVAALTRILDQLTAPTLANLLAENPYVKADAAFQAELARRQAALTAPWALGALTVTDTLAFGTVPIPQLLAGAVATAPVSVSGILPAAGSLTVRLGPLTGPAGRQVPAQLWLPAGRADESPQLIGATATTLQANRTAAPVVLAQTYTGIKLLVPPAEYAKVEAGQYTAAVTWALVRAPLPAADA